MKKRLPLMLLILFIKPAIGQNLNEWLRQKKTQKKYLQTQIAELKIYLELTKKGYKIAKEGLATIHSIKNKEFKLHKNFFDTLLIVNPVIAGNPRLKDITDLHGQINEICNKGPTLLAISGQLTAQELSYVSKVYGKVYDDCQGILNALLTLIRDGNLKMNDAQRLERLEVLYSQMLSNYRFVSSFQSQSVMLTRQRSSEKDQIQTGRALHGLN
ncbi:hypothetical protein [Dyadobacter frigoris]|uniref:TerB family tellurite resistance protein n=1 Tax=Dyadobacter frigoris TaxID=2576211 RepID=A0A4U6CNR3_9BACT|nr:hypothetical protein [Dyadobacter frigoris]TKT85736.1 hypothetical protein FDK13_33425 [Dyadobacter frigoris]